MVIPRLKRRSIPTPAKAPFKILFVSSSGGHLAQLLALEPWWRDHDRTWVSFDTADVRDGLARERVIHCYSPTTRNIPNLIRNFVLAIGVLRKEQPDVIISNGAGVAVPFFWLSRIFGNRTVYLEVYDRIDSATMTGKLVEPVTDLFCVQWEAQQNLYKNAVVTGPVYD